MIQKSGTPKTSSERIVRGHSPSDAQAVFGGGEDPHFTSQHEWVDKIEEMLPSTIGLNLRRKADVKYVETVGGKPIFSEQTHITSAIRRSTTKFFIGPFQLLRSKRARIASRICLAN